MDLSVIASFFLELNMMPIYIDLMGDSYKTLFRKAFQVLADCYCCHFFRQEIPEQKFEDLQEVVVEIPNPESGSNSGVPGTPYNSSESSARIVNLAQIQEPINYTDYQLRSNLFVNREIVIESSPINSLIPGPRRDSLERSSEYSVESTDSDLSFEEDFVLVTHDSLKNIPSVE